MLFTEAVGSLSSAHIFFLSSHTAERVTAADLQQQHMLRTFLHTSNGSLSHMWWCQGEGIRAQGSDISPVTQNCFCARAGAITEAKLSTVCMAETDLDACSANSSGARASPSGCLCCCASLADTTLSSMCCLDVMCSSSVGRPSACFSWL